MLAVQMDLTIEVPGLPAIKLEPLLELRKLDALSDEEMVNVSALI